MLIALIDFVYTKGNFRLIHSFNLTAGYFCINVLIH